MLQFAIDNHRRCYHPGPGMCSLAQKSIGAPPVHPPPPRDNGYVRPTRYDGYGALTVLFNTVTAAGIVSTTHSCQKFSGIRYISDPASETAGVGSVVGPAAGSFVGSFFEGDPFGIAASVLSLATNAISTCFIGYRAWYDYSSSRYEHDLKLFMQATSRCCARQRSQVIFGSFTGV